MATLKKLHKASHELNERAVLSWEYIRRNQQYGGDAEKCLNSLPEDIQRRFAALLEEYPRTDNERWNWAKVNDPVPFKFSYRGHESFRVRSDWQRKLWRFYQKWRLCYPVPSAVNNPHLNILAWLNPRPAERLSLSAREIVVLVNITAPKDRILSCLREEIQTARKMFEITQPHRANEKVKTLYLSEHSIILRVPLRVPQAQTLRDTQAEINKAQRRYGVKAGAKRERPEREKRSIKAWDLMFSEKSADAQYPTLEKLAKSLRCSVRQAVYALSLAYQRIKSTDYPGKREAQTRYLSSLTDPFQHFQDCKLCKGERYCEVGKNILASVTGIPDSPAREKLARTGSPELRPNSGWKRPAKIKY